MRWIEDEAGFERTRRPLYSRPGATLALVLTCAILLSAILGTAAPEKHLAVFSVAANYSVSLMQHDGRDYVGLLELLEPLGRVSAKADGERWRLRYNNVEGDFQEGKNRAKVQGRDADLGAKFLFHNGRGLVPVAALGSLLPRFLGGPVTVHEESGRLFVGGVGTHFTASLAAENPPRLVFHFSAPVNPTIATEAGSLRMTFSREPVVAPASPTLTFGNKAIPSANYSENNGAAVVTVTATVPVMASFSNDGRTITVAPTANAAAGSPVAPSANQPAAGNSAAPAQAAAAAPLNAPAVPAPISRRYFAVVDASHGGDDRGETLSSTLLEK